MSRIEVIILPINGELQACCINEDRIEALARVPGDVASGEHIFPDYTARKLVLLSADGQRLRVFEILTTSPWIRQAGNVLVPPNGGRARAVAIREDIIVVGGHSRCAECLWHLSRDNEEFSWNAIGIPDELKARGKEIDGVHFDGDRMIAVDNVIFPKWILTYRLLNGRKFIWEGTFRLPQHAMSERIIQTHLGKNSLWCLSEVPNRRSQSGWPERSATFIWSQGKEKLDELGVLATYGRETGSKATLRGILLEASDITEIEGALLVACGEEKIAVLSTESGAIKNADAPISYLRTKHLASVNRFMPAPSSIGGGVFATGYSDDGEWSNEWVPYI